MVSNKDIPTRPSSVTLVLFLILILILTMPLSTQCYGSLAYYRSVEWTF